MRQICLALATLPLLGACACAETVEIPVSADANLSAFPSEQPLNYGASNRLRIKGIEMFALFAFDLTPVAGWRVDSAVFRFRTAGECRLRTLGLYTVAQDWREGTGAASESGDGATFLSPFGDGGPWGEGPDFLVASFTHAGTRVAYADVRDVGDGWLEVDVPPWLVDAMRPGESYGFLLTDEKGQTRANNDIYSREQGNARPALTVTGVPGAGGVAAPPPPAWRRPVAGPQPSFALPDALPLQAPPVSASPGLTLAVHDELAKVNPVTGRLLDDGVAAYGQPATLEPATAGIALEAGRNEFVGAMLAVGGGAGGLRGVQLTATPLTGPGGELPAPALSRMWCVRDGEWMPEVCLPLEASFDIPDAANGIEGQTNQSVHLEYYVPHGATPGDYTGSVSVRTAGGGEANVGVLLRVQPAELPDTIQFAVDLNAYGDVSDQYGLESGSDAYIGVERAYHRLAHVHRANYDALPYSHSGSLTTGTAPPLDGQGAARRITDWAAWDRRYGPLLDGSAFADLPRGAIPVQAMYLPFHESWPSSMRYYTFHASTTDYPACIVEHAMLAPPIEEAFEPQFAEEFRAVAGQFRNHLVERGWTTTWMQVYLNNKHYYRDPAQGGRGTSWWLLDEPNHRDDWLALRYFLGLARDEAGAPMPPFVYRGDISRPQWQPDWMDSTFDLLCLGGELYRYPTICSDLAERNQARVWTYGACNEVGRPDLETVAWAWQAVLAGADGIVPWNTIATDANYGKPEATAILYPGKRFGLSAPLPSLRLKALRRGAQDAEYFLQAAALPGVGRPALTDAARAALALEATATGATPEDVRALDFGRLTPEAFSRLRARLRLACRPGTGPRSPQAR
jgi:hypothetical protein